MEHEKENKGGGGTASGKMNSRYTENEEGVNGTFLSSTCYVSFIRPN